MAGPLEGLKIVEMVGLGPAPFCAMMFADMGAEVIRIDRPGNASIVAPEDARFDITARGRRSITIDLKKPEGRQTVLRLLGNADAVVEGFRPGVMERLGLGPDTCLERNPRLVYGRMTGWGQHGPLAHAAGHDINYIALSGALHAIGRPGEPPVVPLNYIGDFGGGGMLLAFGVVCALLEARRSGKGQVVDAAMTDGAALLSAMMYGFRADGSLNNQRGENLLDGGAHFYNTYACADGKYISIGSIEPQFYALLIQLCGIDDPAFQAQRDPHGWPILKYRLADVFRTKTREEWCALMEGTDVCFAPVLDWDEAPEHPHNRSRETFISVDGVTQPAPAPRFSRTTPDRPSAPTRPGSDGDAILHDWGFERLAIDELKEKGVFG
ncbi:CaiB/BaiF CoA transferase family protein [Noviherbaspirillum sp. Root189]|uniref:CaiB/BaiF CoA transferase family protein n=1 Tax=Noviherbaspirillum sp. Root189 TaxID=1736487 RepID=UPI000710AAB0|nr:CaiB/BaiF CoA-transferase family protein [Noviherbaspirillum sp. Root189]KRB84046.1 carnitine dehydratase [Noviherbaspirillum sp. Root189]